MPGDRRIIMKQYVIKYGRFGNEYDLCWISSAEQAAEAAAAGYERISRREAERLCAEENSRRKYDGQFSGFAPSLIYPWDAPDNCTPGYGGYIRNGYIVERG